MLFRLFLSTLVPRCLLNMSNYQFYVMAPHIGISGSRWINYTVDTTYSVCVSHWLEKVISWCTYMYSNEEDKLAFDIIWNEQKSRPRIVCLLYSNLFSFYGFSFGALSFKSYLISAMAISLDILLNCLKPYQYPYIPTIRKLPILSAIITCKYSALLLWHGQFSPTFSQSTSHRSPVRVRYGIYFVDTNSDLYSASITSMMYAISCYLGRVTTALDCI